MRILVTWFSCGRDAEVLKLSAASVIRHLEGDLILEVISDAKDPVGDVGEMATQQGVDHGYHLETLASIVAQITTWRTLIERHRPEVVLKIDSDVLLMRRYSPDAAAIEGQTENGKSLLGGAYSFPASALLQRYPGGAEEDEIRSWSGMSNLLEDRIITGMLAEEVPLKPMDHHLGFHPFSHDLAEEFTFIEFGRLGRCRNPLLDRETAMRRHLT
jgi:hypothetical protein